MIPLHKLSRLSPGQRRRKLALLLAAAERELAAVPAAVRSGASSSAYVTALARFAMEDPKADVGAVTAIGALAAEYEASGDEGTLLRLCDAARHATLAAIGTFPAEWDLIHRPATSPDDSGAVAATRSFFPGVSVYAEDIRSPFNLGSIFRTAEAFGAERVIVSPLCVPPEHPRATRSAMGCVEYLGWERMSLEELPKDLPAFALETGGTPLDEFEFPERGIVVIGSEELGVSPEALARASYGRVSIPMYGIKASLNVGVAFGVLMQAWTAYLTCSASKPF